MKYLCFAAFLAVGCQTASALVWNDCANTSNPAMTVHSFDLQPNPANVPGPVTVNLNLTVNRAIDHLYIDTELDKKTGLFGSIPIPCVNGTDLGSCTDIDACSILTDILSGSSIVSVDLGKQILSILLSALGHNPQCPISPETVVLKDETVNLHAIPDSVAAITDGNYHLKIMIRDDLASNETVGCLEFDFGFKRVRTGGFLFG